MKRSPLLRRSPLKAVTRATRDRVPDHVRAAVLSRANFACEACGYDLLADVAGRGLSIHHRQPRQAGGDRNPARHSPANLLCLCGSGVSGCHGDVESHRTVAYELGRLVRRGFAPAVTPVLIYGRGWCILRADGKADPFTRSVSR